ncbi:MAG: 2-dehydropantoate 2-reductase [Verrucomicrobiota bacterium]
MRICVFGAGGLGGFFGGWLAASGADVTFIARGRHFEAMEQRGLDVRSGFGNKMISPVKVVEDPKQVGGIDILVFAVKSFDLPEAVSHCQPHIEPGTLIVSLLNGVDWVDTLRGAFPECPLAAGITMVPSNILSPGIIQHQGSNKSIVLGVVGGGTPDSLVTFGELMNQAHIDARIIENPEVSLWREFIGWSAGAGVTSLCRQPFGVIQEDSALKKTVKAAMEEVAALARAKNIAISDDTVSAMMNRFLSLPPSAKSSMLVDLEKGKPIELEAGPGTVVRQSQNKGIDTPVNRAILAALGPFANGQ